MIQKLKYFALFKPYGVLSQFTDKEGRPTLAEMGSFPKDVYPVGRLDMDSEGLILLTNDRNMTDKLLNPKYLHEREYCVLVEGIPTDAGLAELKSGVIIEQKKTLPAKAERINEPAWLQPREPLLRLKPSLIYSWISLTITEGRNRQVRKMTANIGNPTIRLIRYRIANISINGLMPGTFRELNKNEIMELKNLQVKNYIGI